MVHIKNTDLYIFLRKYLKFKSEKFRQYLVRIIYYLLTRHVKYNNSKMYGLYNLSLKFSYLFLYICRNLRSEITELKQGNSKHRMETANLKRDINRSVTQYMRHQNCVQRNITLYDISLSLLYALQVGERTGGGKADQTVPGCQGQTEQQTDKAEWDYTAGGNQEQKQSGPQGNAPIRVY